MEVPIPSPKFHCHVVIVPPSGVITVDESVNCVLNPTHTVSTINIASGFGLTTIVLSHV